MVYSYYGKERISSVSIHDNVRFAFHKIRKLWPLHLATTLAVFIFDFIGENRFGLRHEILKLFLNLFMVQEYIPLYDRRINGVSWYLCVTVLFYFLFPWIIRRMEKNYSREKAWISIALSVVMIVILGLVGSKLPNFCYDIQNGNPLVWTNNLTNWFLYSFPLCRIWDILIGCNLGYLFVHRECNRETSCRWKYTALESLAILLVVVGFVLCYISPEMSQTIDGINVIDGAVWWKESLVWLPGSTLLVYSFAIGKGVISNALVNRFTMYIAKISPYAFLIHRVVFRYLNALIYHFPINFDPEFFAEIFMPWICIFIGLPLTVVTCEIWRRLWKPR